jgi:2-polyprenyl-3-methyl-5-hydroxy-6-metoxy-1,4-benzoquinol methylase
MFLTDRQHRELQYHKTHAFEYYESFRRIKFDVLDSHQTRWWNAYWEMFRYIRALDLKDKRVLVVGCGAGHDAIRLAKLGARVDAFDLSPDLIDIGSAIAAEQNVAVAFRQMPAEKLDYPTACFDVVVAVDILHHCELRPVLKELARVSRVGAIWIIDEIYTHSRLQALRECRIVTRFVYPLVSRIIYEGKPYVTEDERKLTEGDVSAIREYISVFSLEYFEAVVRRILPETRLAAKCDRWCMRLMKPLAPVLAGRFVLLGRRP